MTIDKNSARSGSNPARAPQAACGERHLPERRGSSSSFVEQIIECGIDTLLVNVAPLRAIQQWNPSPLIARSLMFAVGSDFSHPRLIANAHSERKVASQLRVAGFRRARPRAPDEPKCRAGLSPGKRTCPACLIACRHGTIFGKNVESIGQWSARMCHLGYNRQSKQYA